jgi:Flp pilus assembly protein protease CpaA
MEPFTLAVAFWIGVHTVFGLFAVDKKIRCASGNPLPDQVCEDKTNQPTDPVKSK